MRAVLVPSRLHPLVALILVVSGAQACRSRTIERIDTMRAEPKCGDGVKGADEECDGTDLGEATCKSKGFDTGAITCDSECKLVTKLCVTRCGNGVIDLGETCDGDAGLMPCDVFGYAQCKPLECTIDTTHCVDPALTVNSPFPIAIGGPTSLGDLSPRGTGDLVFPVVAFHRLETVPWVQQQGFQASSGRKLSFQTTPIATEIIDLNFDGHADIIAVNDDDSVDALLFSSSSFVQQPLFVTGGSCAAPQIVGAGRFGLDDGGTEVALACADGSLRLVAHPSNARSLHDGGVWFAADMNGDALLDLASLAQSTLSLRLAPSWSAMEFELPKPGTSLAMADLDLDGDADAVMVDASSVTLFENTGVGFAQKITWAATSPMALRVADIDLDGRVDIAFIDGTSAVIRRNRGALLFTELRQPGLVSGTFLSFNIGDLDGDGDPDLVVTSRTSGSATAVVVAMNRVR